MRKSDRAIIPSVALADVTELTSPPFQTFMDRLNSFAELHGMRVLKNWSKIWEYPWLWLHGLGDLNWTGRRVVDLGSETSPMPWFLASLDAQVHIVETDRTLAEQWARWKTDLSASLDWSFVDSELLPFPDESVDVVTSFSVIEHQQNKSLAIDEVARVLRPGGVFALSFDICEPSMGMKFPSTYGRALSMREFEYRIWRHPAFAANSEIRWNTASIPAFLEWHRTTVSAHNYVTGAAIMTKSEAGSESLEWIG